MSDTEHLWTLENLAGYHAGGLTGDETQRLQRHLADCPTCQNALAQTQRLDQSLARLFAPVQPTLGLEDRMIVHLRTPRQSFPTWGWLASGIAAALLLASIGAGLQRVMQEGEVPFPGAWLANDGNSQRIHTSISGGIVSGKRSAKHKVGEEHVRILVAKKSIDMGMIVKNPHEMFEEKIVNRNDAPKDAIEIQGEKQFEEVLAHLKGRQFKVSRGKGDFISPDFILDKMNAGIGASIPEGTRAVGIRVNPESIAGGFASLPHSRVDIISTVQRADDKSPFSQVLLENVLVLAADAASTRDQDNRAMPANVVTLALTTEELLKVNVAKQLGTFSLALRRPGDSKSVDSSKITVEDVMSRRNRNDEGDDEDLYSPSQAGRELPRVGSKKVPKDSGLSTWTLTAIEGERERSPLPRSASTYYHRQADNKLEKGPASDWSREEQTGSGTKKSDVKKLDVAQIQPPAKPADPAPALETASTQKVIRTGEVEFIVDSFDAAFAQIAQLIGSIKGAFVVTRNSDKLENGKTKGAIVVRLPPEVLDRFLLDLRRDLGKMGELKNQRIGSQDVSRQYTDVESRLRAARTMEERLLNIIKTGKGEIKDLVAAEQQLGVWHTKIEEMEGEIRYLNNQVALSTLTINLQEKELLTAATLVVSEQVRLRVEVEDVDKGQSTLLAAAKELKGRVSRAELKQNEAHVHIEVPPEHASEMRRRVNELGQVTKQDAERLQKADGGSGKALDSTPRLSDVHFDVVLYNAADIEPAEILQLDVVSKDVPAAFRKLQDAASQAKGQVRKGDLKEEDRRNITGQFDVDVPAAQRAAIDRTVAEIGDVIARTSQSNLGKPSDTVTKSKVGYRIVLTSVAGIAPRETVTLEVEVKHVEQDFAAVVELVRANGGTTTAAQVAQDKAGQTTGQLKFDVPLAAKDDLVRRLRELGTVKMQQAARNTRVPESPLATAQFVVTLTSTGPIVPRDEGLGQQVRTSLFYSFKVLSASLMFLILGASLVLPWGLLVFVGYKTFKWLRGRKVT